MISFCLMFAIGTLAAVEVEVDPSFCKRKEAGFYPHPTECRVFYTCAMDITVVHSCPQGTVFNPDALQCDWPKDVAPPCGSKED